MPGALKDETRMLTMRRLLSSISLVALLASPPLLADQSTLDKLQGLDLGLSDALVQQVRSAEGAAIADAVAAVVAAHEEQAGEIVAAALSVHPELENEIVNAAMDAAPGVAAAIRLAAESVGSPSPGDGVSTTDLEPQVSGQGGASASPN